MSPIDSHRVSRLPAVVSVRRRRGPAETRRPAGRSLQIADVRMLFDVGRAHARERLHRAHDRPQRHHRDQEVARRARHVQSCHTAVVNGYVIEGHVPAADVHRLLKEKPAIAGIAVGGMPIGSPGMESPHVKAEPFDVMSFDKSGATRVFAKH